MFEIPTFSGYLLAVVLFSLLFYGMYRLVRYARRNSRGAYALGTILMLFGIGNIRDPGNEIIYEAKQGRRSEDDDSGEPPEKE